MSPALAKSPRLLLLSNGHGEDTVGVALGRALLALRSDLRLFAYPLVGRGAPYEGLRLEVLGPRRTLPSGGLLLHSPTLLWADLRAGFLGMSAAHLRDLARLETDLLVVVGDVYALALSGLVRTPVRFHVQTLVSAHHRPTGPSRPNRFFMERISYLERALMRHLAQRVYVRDAATAATLARQGVRRVSALGNPMLDALAGQPLPEHADAPCRVALLPGSRGYAAAALTLMLGALGHLPGATGLVAWAGGEPPAAPPGWRLEPGGAQRGLRACYHHPTTGRRAHLYTGRFADVLASAQLALATAGTANEQAAALGLPLVSFALPPHYRASFLANQQRLLGDALTLTEAEPQAIARAVQALLRDEPRYRRAAAAGRARMGRPGGSRAIATDILTRAGLIEG